MSEYQKPGISQEMLTEQTYNMLLGLSPDELEDFRNKWLDRTVPGRTEGEADSLALDFTQRAQEGMLSAEEIAMRDALAKF